MPRSVASPGLGTLQHFYRTKHVPPSDPSGIAGLWAWYDFTALGLADGTPVSAASDLSGNGRDLSNADPVRQFQFKTNAVNGLGALWAVNATARWLVGPTSGTLPQPFTYWGVFKDPANNYALQSHDGNVLIVTDGATAIYAYAGGSDFIYLTDLGSTSWRSLVVAFNGAASTAYSNGVQTAVTGSATVPGSSSYVGGGSAYLPLMAGANTYFAEGAIFDHALTADERAILDAYVASKYGL